MPSRLVGAAVVGGLVAGIVDLGAAALINHVGLDVIGRAIARGLLGKAAMKGGLAVSALGFGLQAVMGMLIGAIFGLAATRLPLLVRRWVAAGLAYGVGIFFVMEYPVVPLSAVRKVPTFTALSFSENMAAMMLFGLIVSFSTRRGARR